MQYKYKCRLCHNPIRSNKILPGPPLCATCKLETTVKCSKCGVSTESAYWEDESMSFVCKDCVSKLKIQTCEVCEQLIEQAAYKIVELRHAVCAECFKELPRCNVCKEPVLRKHFNEDRSMCWYCLKANETFVEYHSRFGREDFREESRLGIGFEIEKEDREFRNSIRALPLVRETGWIVERDGSLSEEKGFELVSPILPLDMNKKGVLNKHLDKVNKFIYAAQTRRCGGHVHVSDRKRTPEQILVDIRGYLPLLYAVYPHRAEATDTDYAASRPFGEYWRSRGGHHQAINITDRTLEFRLFSSPRSRGSLDFRTDLIRFMLTHPIYSIKELVDELIKKGELFNILARVYTETQIYHRAKLAVDLAKKNVEIGPDYYPDKLEAFIKSTKLSDSNPEEADYD